jgi:hypothetical protein
MVRVPQTKNGAKVMILRESNGDRVPIPPSLYRPFLNQLMGEDQVQPVSSACGRVDWIENLLLKTINDGRGCAVERIFCPYLIRRIPKDDAFVIIKNWLDKCLTLRPLTKNILDISIII